MIECYHILIYVPTADANAFIASVSPHIPQFIGHYDHVCWRSAEGTGQFRPLEGADPADGEIGVINHVPEIRFECLLKRDVTLMARFIEDVVKPAHPYEEPVITISETILARS